MTDKKMVCLLVFDGLADWEPALAMATINQTEKYQVKTVGLSPDPVVSMGGIRILPDLTLGDLSSEGLAMIIVPGGKMWEEAPAVEVYPVLKSMNEAGVILAFICGATLIPVDLGLTAGRKHTSNALDYVQNMMPGYGDQDFYLDRLAVRDGNLITASGLGSLEFAVEIARALELFSEEELEQHYQMFKHGITPSGKAEGN